MKKGDILAFVLLMLSAPVFAQNSNNFQKMVDFLPPAPNASAIIKHNAIGVGNSGSPNVTIPLFSVQGMKLSTSVSIGYNSTGIKVDEIASRVGMGWSIQAGGVVTRTIRGWEDENCTRLAAPAVIGNNCGTYNFCNDIVSSSNAGGHDAEPDLYNFSMNGISGSFVYDANNNPVVIPAQKFKIEKNLASSDWNFKITTSDGIKYYFGGSTATEKTKRLSGCGREYTIFRPTSWYLIKIEHPTAEVINFSYEPITYNYENGVNETQNWAWWQLDYNYAGEGFVNCPSGECPPAPPSSTCVSTVQTQGVLLSSISNNFSTYNFSYIARDDCNDKLVSVISMYNAGVYTGKFLFTYHSQAANMTYANQSATGYNYTPYLTSVNQVSSDNLVNLYHNFFYNDIANRPPRLSFSQDHWGYFNGKVNATTFIPKPKNADARAKFPNALADREVDPAFASKGMLTKIVYPTGGVDTIHYESNEWLYPREYNTPHEYSCTVTGAGAANNSTFVSQSTDFTIDKSQRASLTFSCINNGNGTVFDNHNWSEVIVLNVGTNTQVYSYGIHTGETLTVPLGVYGDLSPGTYRLTYKARGAVITTSVLLKYNANTHLADSNTIVGGVRVKRVLTGNPETTPMIKRYYYSEPQSLNQSSLHYAAMPVYLKSYSNTVTCTVFSPGGTAPHAALCHLEAMYSGSQNNIFDYQGAAVSYHSIIESVGEQFEGGARQTRFYAGADVPPQPVLGELMLGAPMSNFSQIGNGRVYEEIIFKKSSSGGLIPQKKTRDSLINDPRSETVVFGYAVNKKRSIVYATPVNTCPPGTPVSDGIMSCFDINKYYITSPWLHLESQTETLYDENGLNPVTSTRNYYYDNLQHLQLSRTETLNSKNQLIKEANTYPSDHSSTAPYNSMVTNNILTPIVTTATSIAGNPDIPVQQGAIDYGSAGGNNYEPIIVKKSVKGNTLEVEGTIDLYDANGRILQFKGKDEIVSTVIWGYNYRYPVAKITGANYTAVTNVLGVTIPALQSMTGSTLLAQLNNIRTSLPAARVTSYTYNPGIGVASITDADNKTNNYEYDGLGRLVIIKDQDNNVVKKNEYNVGGYSSTNNLNIFFNALQTRTVTCNNCANGYTGNSMTYTIPYGKYFSLVSQNDADAQATADTGGQEYANINGTCINSVNATCTGVGYKVVNCVCELGTKECVSSTATTGGWWSTFQYRWSDGSTGIPFTEFVATCVGVDKKFLNCICEQGQKINCNVTNNQNGTYDVSYQWKWSDNSTSSTIIETISCSGPDKKMIGCECKTAIKVYISSDYCSLSNTGGCCAHMWKCVFYYKWSDNSTSLPTTYTECSSESCMPTSNDFDF